MGGHRGASVPGILRWHEFGQPFTLLPPQCLMQVPRGGSAREGLKEMVRSLRVSELQFHLSVSLSPHGLCPSTPDRQCGDTRPRPHTRSQSGEVSRWTGRTWLSTFSPKPTCPQGQPVGQSPPPPHPILRFYILILRPHTQRCRARQTSALISPV